MARALVTGGAGFVGANLVRELVVDGRDVRVLARRDTDLRNLAGVEVEIARGDVRESGEVLTAMKGCDDVFHVAAFYSTREADAPLMYEVNVEGTKNVLNAANKLNVRRVVHTSSIGTIGRPTRPVAANEDCEFNMWETATHYARSKYEGERAALKAATEGLPVVVVNPCAPVGPYDSRPSATGQRVVDFLNGKMPSIVGAGVNFVDVGDVARGHILAASRGLVGQRYILGNKNLTYSEFVAILRIVSGEKGPRPGKREIVKSVLDLLLLRRSKPNLDERTALTCDCSRAVTQLGMPQTPLEIAFKRSVTWYRDNGYVPGLIESKGA